METQLYCFFFLEFSAFLALQIYIITLSLFFLSLCSKGIAFCWVWFSVVFAFGRFCLFFSIIMHNWFFQIGFFTFVNPHFLNSYFFSFEFLWWDLLPFHWLGAMWLIRNFTWLDLNLVLILLCRYDYSGYGASTGKVATIILCHII